MVGEQNVAALRRALARRADLQKELEQIDLFLTLYKQFSEGDEPPDITPPAPQDSPGQGTQESHPSKRKGGMSQSDTEAVVRDILLSHGRPMVIPELIQRIRDRGRIVGGQDEISNLKTKLWRAKERITNISGAGYWPTDVGCEAVGYRPPDTSGSS